MADIIQNTNNNTVVSGTENADVIENSGKTVTIEAGEGDDVISLKGSAQLVNYGSGNDTVYGYTATDTIKTHDGYSTVLGSESSGDKRDVILRIGTGSITLKYAEGTKLNVDGDMLGIKYDSKKGTVTVTDPFTGVVDAASYSNRITKIDASAATGDLTLKAGDTAAELRAGKNGSTLYGGKSADKLYGGNGADYFMYTVGQGADVLNSVEAQDVVSISGTTVAKMSFVDNKNVLTVTFDGNSSNKITINKSKSEDAIKFNVEGEELIYGKLPDGAKYDDNSKKTEIILGSTKLEEDVINVNAADIVSTAKTVNGAAAANPVYLVGNNNANALVAGNYGSTLYGGKSTKAVADVMIGGNDTDVFIYSSGDGKDVINKFDGTQGDLVVVQGATAANVNSSTVKINTNSVVLTLDKNNVLTFNDPIGEIKFYSDTDTTKDPIYKAGKNLPNAVGYNPKKTAITIGSSTDNEISIDLTDPNYQSTVKEVNATAYGGALEVTGNALANVLYAGTGGATLDGGDGKDVLYGGSGSDTFIYVLGQGQDVFNSVSAQDTVAISGTTLDKIYFSDKGNAVNISFDGDSKSKLTLNKTDSLNAITFVINSGTTTTNYTYGSLPGGAGFDSKKTAIILTSDVTASVALNAADVVSTAKTINGAAAGAAVSLVGNDNANVIVAGNHGSTLYGGHNTVKAAADKLIGGGGKDVFVYYENDGKDVISNFNGKDGDFVYLPGVTELKEDAIGAKGTKVTVKIKNSVLTLDDPQGRVDFVTENADGTLVTLNSVGINLDDGVDYNAQKTAIIVSSDATIGTVSIDLSTGAYANGVKEINATAFDNEVSLTGDANANTFYASKNGSTMDGGAGADKLYGGTGVDHFKYTLGDGADVLNSVEAKDFIDISGTTIANMTFVDKGNAVNITFSGDSRSKLTINKQDSLGAITFNDGTTTYTYGYLPPGAGFDSKKTAIILTSDVTASVALNAADVVSTAKTIDGSAAGAAVSLVGNNNANVIVAGAHGSTLYGGHNTVKAAADKLIGGGGKDVFVYAADDGKDVISNFNGKDNDIVLLPGITELKNDAIAVSTNKVVLTLPGKNNVLTLDDPKGRVDFYTENADGTLVSLNSVGINLDDGVEYNKNKTAIIIDSDAKLTDSTFDLGSGLYASTVKEINASVYSGDIMLVGNAQKNVLRAGKGAATLNGSYDATGKKATADVLYGGSDTDTFVWDASLGGADVIYNYNYAQGDIISVTGGGNDFNKTAFSSSGKNVVLTIGKNKLTLNDVGDNTVVAVSGNDTITFNSLPGGVTYGNDKKTVLNIAATYAGGTIDATDYASGVVTIDGSAVTADFTLIGSKKAKILKTGTGNTTVKGNEAAEVVSLGSGADTFIYSTVGGSKDVLYGFDAEKDKIQLSDSTVSLGSFSEKGNDVILTTGRGSITIKDAPRQATINVLKSDGTAAISYKTLPENVTYKAGKLTAAKAFTGTLAVSELGGLSVTEINASAATGATNLQGGSTATKISASKGGSVMLGGDGNDTLVGGAGKDTFKTGGGKDIFDKYTSGTDEIEITSGTVSSSKMSGSKDVELTLSTGGTVTVKGALGKAMTIIQDGVKSNFTVTKDGDDPFKSTTPSTPDPEPADGGSDATQTQFATSLGDYWFTSTNVSSDELGSILGEISSADDAAIASMSTQFDAAKSLMNNLASNAIEKKKQK